MDARPLLGKLGTEPSSHRWKCPKLALIFKHHGQHQAHLGLGWLSTTDSSGIAGSSPVLETTATPLPLGEAWPQKPACAQSW